MFVFDRIENIFKSCFHGIKYILPPIVSELTEQIVRTIAGLGLLLFLCPEDPGAATAMIVGHGDQRGVQCRNPYLLL